MTLEVNCTSIKKMYANDTATIRSSHKNNVLVINYLPGDMVSSFPIPSSDLDSFPFLKLST